ncbi:MAG: metallophosphoesterase [Woeseiaceae bacterium]|nr:metallophosphoesterase [Woeseiaceae bacterium]MDX2608520.1 metallophosphoesterase [Woeseiaceae bacterium]
MQRYPATRGSGQSLGRSQLLALLICPFLLCAAAAADDWHYSDVKRIVAVGDVHGAYDALISTLQYSDVIDGDLAWVGGSAHLVFTGDLLDRGPKSRLVMDLIIRLEQEASSAGGMVHLVLGNHEVMNLIGDLRYVSAAEYAAFLDLESAEEREQWYQKYRLGKPDDSEESIVRWEFDEKAPPGYFGHRRAFRPDGTYGKWLLDKPLMIVINDTLFVHGGVPPLVAERGLAGGNIGLKKELFNYVTARVKLEDAAVMSPVDRFKAVPSMLKQKNLAGEIPDEYFIAMLNILALSQSPLYGPASPTWYRGTATCNTLVEGDQLNFALNKVGAERVVMGHTSTITHQVQQRMNGRIVEIDTGMLKASYEGSGNALIIEGGELSVVNQDGRTDLSPIEPPMIVGNDSIAISDAVLADILANGNAAELSDAGTERRLVQVTAGEHSVLAYFREHSGEERDVPELAAYKLDRMLQLGMVPMTVRREIDGTQGTLEYVPAGTITEFDRAATGKGAQATCSIGKQTGAMRVFDTLINNSARTPSSMLYNPDDLSLMLVDHERSFGADLERPAYLTDIAPAIGDQWCAALSELNDEALRAELGDVLNDDQLAALGARRDALLNGSADHAVP